MRDAHPELEEDIEKLEWEIDLLKQKIESFEINQKYYEQIYGDDLVNDPGPKGQVYKDTAMVKNNLESAKFFMECIVKNLKKSLQDEITQRKLK